MTERFDISKEPLAAISRDESPKMLQSIGKDEKNEKTALTLTLSLPLEGIMKLVDASMPSKDDLEAENSQDPNVELAASTELQTPRRNRELGRLMRSPPSRLSRLGKTTMKRMRLSGCSSMAR